VGNLLIRRWSDDDRLALKRLNAGREPVQLIARKLRRTESSVRSTLKLYIPSRTSKNRETRGGQPASGLAYRNLMLTAKPRARITIPWTLEELEELKELLYRGKSLESLAVHFRRRKNGVLMKLRHLGLPTPVQLKQCMAQTGPGIVH